MTRSVVPGDPSSLSILGADALRAGRRLQADAQALASRRADEAGGVDRTSSHEAGTPRVRKDLDQRTSSLISATLLTAEEMLRIVRLFQERAAELSTAQHTLQGLRDRATAAGLGIDGSHVSLPWGITGSADADVQAKRVADRDHLQADLDRLQSSASTRRRALEREVKSSTAALTRIIEGLS